MISLGRPFGFPVTLDPTALFVMALIVLPGVSGGGSLAFGLVSGVLLFGSVLVHELGHAFLARRAGLGPVTIKLHGFGGLTSFSKSPEPRQGIWITLAGPASSIALGLLTLPLVWIGPDVVRQLASNVVWMNLFWGAFNLLPMFPLDGGMILYHGLGLSLDRNVAAVWAARVGVVAAVVVGIAGWQTGHVFVAIIAVFALIQSVPIAIARP